MHRLALGAVVMAFGALSASAAFAGMKVTSDDIKNGAVGTKAMEANVFGCDGSNASPSLEMDRGAGRHQELCHQSL